MTGKSDAVVHLQVQHYDDPQMIEDYWTKPRQKGRAITDSCRLEMTAVSLMIVMMVLYGIWEFLGAYVSRRGMVRYDLLPISIWTICLTLFLYIIGPHPPYQNSICHSSPCRYLIHNVLTRYYP